MNKFKECNQCPYEFNDKNLEPCKDCVPKKKTNADRIRAMDDKELADFLGEYVTRTCHYCLECGISCKDERLKWLKAEAEGE